MRVRGRGRENQEDGCADFPHCLKCPAPVCRYDNARTFKRWLAEAKRNGHLEGVKPVPATTPIVASTRS